MWRNLLLILVFSGSACSESENSGQATDSNQDHVWKEQTATLDRAKEAEKIIMESAEAQRKIIEQQTQ